MSGTRKHHERRHRAPEKAGAARARLEHQLQQDAERVLEFVRELSAPAGALEIRAGLERTGKRMSEGRVRQLLTLLVLRRALLEVPASSAPARPMLNPVRPRGRRLYSALERRP